MVDDGIGIGVGAVAVGVSVGSGAGGASGGFVCVGIGAVGRGAVSTVLAICRCTLLRRVWAIRGVFCSFISPSHVTLFFVPRPCSVLRVVVLVSPWPEPSATKRNGMDGMESNGMWSDGPNGVCGNCMG